MTAFTDLPPLKKHLAASKVQQLCPFEIRIDIWTWEAAGKVTGTLRAQLESGESHFACLHPYVVAEKTTNCSLLLFYYMNQHFPLFFSNCTCLWCQRQKMIPFTSFMSLVAL